MEYRIEGILKKLVKQRESLIDTINSLNENLPNYGIKVNDLNNQIMIIDGQINNYILCLKDIEVIRLQNELTIKTQIK